VNPKVVLSKQRYGSRVRIVTKKKMVRWKRRETFVLPVRYSDAMRRSVLIVLCACHSSAPPVEPVPLPPTEAEQAAAAARQDAGVPQDISKWPAFPTIPAPPVSIPAGDPIPLPVYAPKAGDSYREQMTTSLEQHYVHAGTTRFQRTDTKYDLDVRVETAAGDHPTKVEVATTTAHETVALADAPTTTPREDEDLFFGTYIVGPGPGGGFERDEAVVTRGGGVKVYGREQEELGSLFGVTLREGDSVARLVRGKRLRAGEVVPLSDDDKQKVAGAQPVPGAFTLAVVAADGKTVTYQLDVVSTSTDKDTTTELRMTGTIKLERATSRVLEERNQLRKVERAADSTDETFDTQTTVFTYH
jgi:hypothetical protein